MTCRAGILLSAVSFFGACARPYVKQVSAVTRLDSSRISQKELAEIDVVKEPTARSPSLTVEVREDIRGPQQKAGVYQTYTQQWGSKRNDMHWKNGQPDAVGGMLNVLNFPTFSAVYLAGGVVALGLEPFSPCAARKLMAGLRNVLLVFLSETSATVDCHYPVGSPITRDWADTGSQTTQRRPFAQGAITMLVDGKAAKEYVTDASGRLSIDLVDDVMGSFKEEPQAVAIALRSPAGKDKFEKSVNPTARSVIRALYRRSRALALARRGDASLQAGDLPDAIRRFEEAAATDDGISDVNEKLRDLRSRAKAEGPARWARSLALSGIANTPAERRDSLAAGRIVWEKNAFSAEGFGLDAAVPAWTNVERAAAELLKLDMEKFSGTSSPRAPKLVQGDYEPAAVFAGRVAQEKRKYEAEVSAYDAKVASYPAWRRNAVLQTALNIVFGSPQVVKARDYDPNSQIFSPQVASESPFAKDFRQTFAIAEPVPYEQAEAFDQALQASSPRVFFERRGAKIAFASAEFDLRGKAYSALPAGAASGQAQSLARVDLGEGKRAALDASLSVEYAENPAIASRLAELDKLKRENAAKEELKALEAQIAELKRGEKRAYKSDVDQPAFSGKARRPDDLALIIGIESYQDSHLPKADFAQRDAEAVYAYLQRLGVPAENIARLSGDAATAGRIKGYLQSWLPKNAKPESRVYFYYSGHGAPDPVSHDAYLLSWDGDPGLLKTTAVSLAEVYADLGRLPAKEVLVAMDSCFSGASGRSVIKKGARPLVSVRMEEALAPNLTVLAAAQGDEIANSLEKEGHGLFTYYLLKGLGRASGQDSLKAQDLCGRLKSEVKEAAARDNSLQVPVCQGADFKFW